MHLFYNIDEHGKIIADTVISPEHAAAREVIQRENSEGCAKSIYGLFCNYNNSDYANFLPVNKDVINRIKHLFLTYEAYCSKEYASDPFTHLLEIQRWEEDFIAVMESLQGDDNSAVVFRNTILRQIEALILKAKLSLFREITNTYGKFQEKIKSIFIRMHGDPTPEKLKSLTTTVKRIAVSFSAPGSSWKSPIPLIAYHIIEAENLLLLNRNNLRGFTSIQDAFAFQSDFSLYKMLVQYERHILVEEAARKIPVKRKTRSPKSKSMESYIVSNSDKNTILSILHKSMKGKFGKQAVMVIRAAFKAGLTSIERIPFSTIKAEFGDVGAQSGYYRFFDNDIMPEEEYRNLTEMFMKIKPVDQ